MDIDRKYDLRQVFALLAEGESLVVDPKDARCSAVLSCFNHTYRIL